LTLAAVHLQSILCVDVGKLDPYETSDVLRADNKRDRDDQVARQIEQIDRLTEALEQVGRTEQTGNDTE